MNEQLTGTVDEAREMHRERSAFYRLLAGLYYREMTAPMIESLAASLPACADDDPLAPGFKELRRYLVKRGADARTDLAVDYARIFLSAGTYEGVSACPYESIYTSEDGLVMQEARDEVVGIYAANGFAVNADACEPEDHVSFELEFVAAMADRAAEALVAGDSNACAAAVKIQRAFLEEHLLNWVDAWGEKIEQCAETRFYPALFSITKAFIEQDRGLLDELLCAA